MNLSLEKLSKFPEISSFFGGPSTVREVINSYRFSDDTSARQFFKVYDDLPVGDREQLLRSSQLLEAVALSSGLNPKEFLGELLFCFRSCQAQKSGIKAMAEHPDVVSASLLYAMSPSGVADRRMLHEAVGFLPTPKGMSLNFNLPQAEAPKVVSEDTSPDVNEVFPTISEKEQTWQDRRSKLLEAEN